MKLGVSLHPLWTGGGDVPGRIAEAAIQAERAGLDHVRTGGHLLRGAVPRESQDLDPLVMLSVVAAVTRRLRLVAGILVLPLYEPVGLAGQTASLDVVSNGRFTLGAGVGWDRAEFDAVGVPFGERGARTDRALATMRRLWASDDLAVPPHTPGGPPVWVGGNSDAALRRALRFGEAWHGSGVDAAALVEVRGRLERLAPHDRTANPLELTAVNFLVPPGFRTATTPPGRPIGGPDASLDAILDEFGRLSEAGLTTCSLWMPLDAAALPDAIAWLATEIQPKLARTDA